MLYFNIVKYVYTLYVGRTGLHAILLLVSKFLQFIIDIINNNKQK